MKLLTSENRVGVMGTYNSGKTVFLTSLINHLLHHDPKRFDLGKANNIKNPVIRPVRGLPLFEYEKYRAELIHHGSWPAKTLGIKGLELQLDFFGKWTRRNVELVDIPGECVADAAIAGLDYQSWAKLTTDRIEILSSSLGWPTVDKSLMGFKTFLARCRNACLPQISPSSFILDSSSFINSHLSIEAMAASRKSGCSGAEFTPFALEHDEIHYLAYKSEVALPSLSHLRRCDTLVVLVDIAMFLNSGHQMANDSITQLRDLLEFCKPEGKGLTKIGSLHQVFRKGSHLFEMANDGCKNLAKKVDFSFLPKNPWDKASSWLSSRLFQNSFELILNSLDRVLNHSKISKIAMVATKCDQVHQDDRDLMLHHLKTLFSSTLNRYDVEIGWFNVASVKTTQSHPEKHQLFGFADGESKEQWIEAPTVPLEWPDSYTAGEFAFPEFKPRPISSLYVKAPDHLGLDYLASYILDLK